MMASLRQLLVTMRGVRCDFVRCVGALRAFCATIEGVATKNLASLAARRWRRRTRDGNVALQVQKKLLQQQARLIVEQRERELCDLLRQQATILAKTLVQAREVRVDFLRTLLLLRQRVREYAVQYSIDEKRLMGYVMLRLRLSRFLDRTVLATLIKYARRLEKVYLTTDFESVTLDNTINEFLYLREDTDAATKLRNYMRAIARQYVDVTDRSEAIRFLRELAAQLEYRDAVAG